MTDVKIAEPKSTEVKIAPANLPLAFGADIKYTLVLAALTAIGVLGSSYVSARQPKFGIPFWVMTGLYLLLFALMVSLRVRVDADGILQKWLVTGTRVSWKQIVRLNRTRRAYGLYGADNKELILLAFLTPAAQQAIAEQAIHRARLRKCAVAPKPPVLEQWERKK
jgi:hypothetical protein